MSSINSSMAGLESLDITVLNRLHDDMGEDVEEVVAAFLESIDDLLASLKSRSADGSSVSICRWAHSIKSSAASIGMMKLSGIAFALETGLKKDKDVGVDLLVSQIEDEYNLARELLYSR